MVTSQTNLRLEATTSKALPLRLVLKVIMRSSIPMPYLICLGIIQLVESHGKVAGSAEDEEEFEDYRVIIESMLKAGQQWIMLSYCWGKRDPKTGQYDMQQIVIKVFRRPMFLALIGDCAILPSTRGLLLSCGTHPPGPLTLVSALVPSHLGPSSSHPIGSQDRPL